MTFPKEHKVDIEQSLREWLSGAQRVIIIGIGNPFRRDDFVGVETVRKLQNHVSQSVYLIEAEAVPESFIDPIIKFKPSHILIIDAGVMNQKPGTSKLVDPQKLMRKSSISTHILPLRIFCDYLAETTAAKIALVIVQPQDYSFGEKLTPKVKQTAKNLATLLQKLLP